MIAYRGIDAACTTLVRLEYLCVEIFAHTMQTLEFKIQALTGKLRYHRNAVGIVGRKLGVKGLSFIEQKLGTGKVGNVGICLAGEYRVTGKAFHLGMLDLSIPISAFDQSHWNSVAGFHRQ